MEPSEYGGIYVKDLLALARIAELGKARASELADIAGRSKTSVYLLVGRLLRHGLVEARGDDYVVTERGLRLLREVAEELGRALQTVGGGGGE